MVGTSVVRVRACVVTVDQGDQHSEAPMIAPIGKGFAPKSRLAQTSRA